MNSFRFVYIKNYQRRSLAPVRYTACAHEEDSSNPKGKETKSNFKKNIYPNVDVY
jgi:hypothetical protein